MIIKSANLDKTVFSPEGLLLDSRSKIVFIGRSNVGKSSLINKLAGRKNLARSSSRPGKTISINYYDINEEFYFVDLPGYGYSKISKIEKSRVDKLINQFFLKSTGIKLVLLLIDCRRGFMNIDLNTLEQLSTKNFKILTIFTKSDKLSNSNLKNQLTKYQNDFDLKVIPFSIKGRDAVLPVLENIEISIKE